MAFQDPKQGIEVVFEDDLWNQKGKDPSKTFTQLTWYGSRQYRLYPEEYVIVQQLLGKFQEKNPFITIEAAEIAYYMLDENIPSEGFKYIIKDLTPALEKAYKD